MKTLEQFGDYYEHLKVGDYTDLKDVKGFKRFWLTQYGDVTTKIDDAVFKLFLTKYKGDFRLTADELNEFCKLDEDDENYSEIEGTLWI